MQKNSFPQLHAVVLKHSEQVRVMEKDGYATEMIWNRVVSSMRFSNKYLVSVHG